MRGATFSETTICFKITFLLTRPMRGATITRTGIVKNISISTRTPHAGRDRRFKHTTRSPIAFLLTRPMRGATGSSRRGCRGVEFLLTRPMRGATIKRMSGITCINISTHTPHAGRDTVSPDARQQVPISTHTPHAGRDCFKALLMWQIAISTHTPHAGRDNHSFQIIAYARNFYSHAPCGARPGEVVASANRRTFLLTRPMRGATNGVMAFASIAMISTHTPHAGRDDEAKDPGAGGKYFYSHAPCGARRSYPYHSISMTSFLLTRPMRGATWTWIM